MTYYIPDYDNDKQPKKVDFYEWQEFYEQETPLLHAINDMAEKIVKLRKERQEAREELERWKDWRWTWHPEQDLETIEGLPVPRLQFVYETNDYEGACTQLLVYKHFLDHDVGIVLGKTRVSGGSATKILREDDNTAPWIPFRDGSHIRHNAKQLGLRAFAVYEDVIHEFNLESSIVEYLPKSP